MPLADEPGDFEVYFGPMGLPIEVLDIAYQGAVLSNVYQEAVTVTWRHLFLPGVFTLTVPEKLDWALLFDEVLPRQVAQVVAIYFLLPGRPPLPASATAALQAATGPLAV